MKNRSGFEPALLFRAIPAAVALVAALACTASADLPPLASDNYRIDLHPGPVLGNTRVVGLSGAFGSIAEGAVGIAHNPASVGNRPRHERERLYWDFGFDYLAPGRVQGSRFDFDNNGRSLSTRMLVLDMGGLVQFERFGAGVHVQLANYKFDDSSTPSRRFDADIGTVHAPLGLAMFSHALVAGAGVRVGFLDIHEQGGRTAINAQTVGLELGLLFRPTFLPIRLSAALHTPLMSRAEFREDEPPTIFLPKGGVAAPFECSFGFSVFLSGRKYNKIPQFDAKTYEKENLRWFQKMSLLVSFGLLITGNTRDAIGIDGFLEQVYERSGASTGVSPRFGVEAEVWPGRVRVRHGLYWEPGRTANRDGRLHATFSTDVRLVDFELFGSHALMVSFASDIADRYVNLSLSVGFWNGT